jgi:hypothetical protein
VGDLVAYLVNQTFRVEVLPRLLVHSELEAHVERVSHRISVDEVADRTEAITALRKTPGRTILLVLGTKTAIREIICKEVGLDMLVGVSWQDVATSHTNDKT